MIEKVDRNGPADGKLGNAIADKLDELIEASNRQDRVIAMLCRNMPGGMAQHLRFIDEDFYTTLGRSEEDEAASDAEAANRG